MSEPSHEQSGAPAEFELAADLDFNPCSIATRVAYNLAQGIIDNPRLTAPRSLYMFGKKGTAPAVVSKEFIPISPIIETETGREIQLALVSDDLDTNSPDIDIIALTRGDVAVRLGGWFPASNEASCAHFDIDSQEITDESFVSVSADEIGGRRETIEAVKELLTLRPHDYTRELVRESLAAAYPDFPERTEGDWKMLLNLITAGRAKPGAPDYETQVAIGLLRATLFGARFGRRHNGGLPVSHPISCRRILDYTKIMKAFLAEPSLAPLAKETLLGSDIPIVRNYLTDKVLQVHPHCYPEDAKKIAKAAKKVSGVLNIDERFDTHLGAYNPAQERIIKSIGILVAKKTVGFTSVIKHGGQLVRFDYCVDIVRDGPIDIAETEHRPHELPIKQEPYKKNEDLTVKIDRTAPEIDPDTLRSAEWLIGKISPKASRR